MYYLLNGGETDMITEDEGGGSVLYPVPVLNSNFGADNQGE